MVNVLAKEDFTWVGGKVVPGKCREKEGERERGRETVSLGLSPRSVF